MDSWINKKVFVGNTDNHGVGTFALEKIKRGEIVMMQGGCIVHKDIFDTNPEYDKYSYHCFQVEKDFYICPKSLIREDFEAIFNVNHSCDPTCGFHGQLTLIALRDIEKGEEITFDYAMTDMGSENDGWSDMKCLCCSKKCRGFITGKDWQKKELQEKYKGFFSNYIQDLI